MKILIACEESQAVCSAFRELGYEAYSCDIEECSGGHPEWHIKQDAIPLIDGCCCFKTCDGVEHKIVGQWDLLIAHPPCTYLTNAGARWLFAGKQLNEERYNKGLEAKAFFMKFYNAKCNHIAIENPIPSSIFSLPKASQVIQPYEYGHPYSKKTCLWLKGLPLLTPTNIVEEHIPYVSSGTYSKTHDPKYKGASRKDGSAKSRSKTFPGIAKAMVEQWSKHIEEQN